LRCFRCVTPRSLPFCMSHSAPRLLRVPPLKHVHVFLDILLWNWSRWSRTWADFSGCHIMLVVDILCTGPPRHGIQPRRGGGKRQIRMYTAPFSSVIRTNSCHGVSAQEGRQPCGAAGEGDCGVWSVVGCRGGPAPSDPGRCIQAVPIDLHSWSKPRRYTWRRTMGTWMP
jgi:hypothetical protein